MENMEFDLSGFSEEDLGEMLVQSKGTEEVKEKVDLYDNKFDISYFGFIPTTIYKEDIEVLTAIIKLTAKEPASKVKLFNTIRELNIFLEHIKIKLEKMELDGDEMVEDAREVYTKMHEKIYQLNQEVELFDYTDVSSRNSVEGGGVDQTSIMGTEKELTDQGIVSDAQMSCINTDEYDTHPERSCVFDITKKYKTYLNITNYNTDLINAYAALAFDIQIEKVPARSKELIKSLISYETRNYYYSDREAEVLRKLDFPCSLSGLDKYLKSSITAVLDSYVRARNKSRNRYEEVSKEVAKARIGYIESNYITFLRKEILMKINQRLGVNASCIYF